MEALQASALPLGYATDYKHEGYSKTKEKGKDVFRKSKIMIGKQKRSFALANILLRVIDGTVVKNSPVISLYPLLYE